MIRDCKKVGNPIPQYEEVGGGFSVTLPFKEPIRSIVDKELRQLAFNKLIDREKEIVNLLQHGPLTRQEIMAKTKSKQTGRSMQLILARLKNWP